MGTTKTKKIKPAKKKWIPKDLKEGTFTAQAKKAGMGVQEFADKVMNNTDQFSLTTVKRANFARNMKKVGAKKKKK
jgi:hypothetical protein